MTPLLTALFLASLQSARPLESRAQALSRDERLFAYSVSDGTVHIAALPEGKPIAVASGFARMVDDLRFSPDGKQLASVAADGRIRLVNSADGKLVNEFAGAPAVFPRQWNARTIDFVDGGTKLLIAGGDAKARLLERADGKLVREITLRESKAGPGEDETITASAVSADLEHFALGDMGGRYAVFSAKSGAIGKGPFAGTKWVNSLDFSPDGLRLAIGADDCRVRVRSLEMDGPPREYSHCDEDLFGSLAIGFVRFAPDGKSLFATSHDFWEVRRWDLETGKALWHYDYGGGNAGRIQACLTKDRAFVVVSPKGTLLDAVDGKLVLTLSEGNPFGSVSWYTAVGEWAWKVTDTSIHIQNLRDGKLACELPFVMPPNAESPREALQSQAASALKSHAQALSDDGRLFAYSVSDGTVHISSLPEGKPVVVASGFSRELGGLAFSPDGKELATVAPDGRIRIVACKDGGLLMEFKGPPAAWPSWWTSRAIAFVDGGTKLLVGGHSAEVDLIRRSDGEALCKILLSGRRVTASTVSADSEHFAIGDGMGRCAVYSAKSGELVFGPIEAAGQVNALALDAHGQRLAVGSRDARLYTIAKGATPVLLSHASVDLTGELEIGYVAFSSDGAQLLSTSLLAWDMRIWDAQTGAMQWSTTRGFDGSELPVVAHFVALPAPGVITSNGFLFDAVDGKPLPGIGEPGYWDFHVLAGRYAWRDGPRGIEVSDVRTGTRVCTLPLTGK